MECVKYGVFRRANLCKASTSVSANTAIDTYVAGSIFTDNTI